MLVFSQKNMSSDKGPLVDWVIQGIIPPSYIGITISYYKDPHKPASIMECHKGFDHCSHDFKKHETS